MMSLDLDTLVSMLRELAGAYRAARDMEANKRRLALFEALGRTCEQDLAELEDAAAQCRLHVAGDARDREPALVLSVQRGQCEALLLSERAMLGVYEDAIFRCRSMPVLHGVLCQHHAVRRVECHALAAALSSDDRAAMGMAPVTDGNPGRRRPAVIDSR